MNFNKTTFEKVSSFSNSKLIKNTKNIKTNMDVL
jgi:hypothetical protein